MGDFIESLAKIKTNGVKLSLKTDHFKYLN
jgi:hypothetical protein